MDMETAINCWQDNPAMHPLTCNNGCGYMEYKEGNRLICKKCGWEQEIYDNIKDLLADM